MDYGISREHLEEYIKENGLNYNWGKRTNNENNFDLYLQLHGNQGYRVATYSKKTKRIELTCPTWHIPTADTLERFMGLCEKN